MTRFVLVNILIIVLCVAQLVMFVKRLPVAWQLVVANLIAIVAVVNRP